MVELHIIWLNYILYFSKCVRKLKNNKTGGSDGLVGELLKYGGSGMVDLLEQLFSVIWQEEIVPRQWRDGLIVNIFKKGDRENPANYRGITLLSVVGKVFCKILKNRLVQCLDKKEHYMRDRLALDLTEVAWIICIL